MLPWTRSQESLTTTPRMGKANLEEDGRRGRAKERAKAREALVEEVRPALAVARAARAAVARLLDGATW